ncbi:MAG: glycosyltransferase [Clostridium sp.]|uniref:glycosyltransferase n=1 Tax=Clostridium sp. TaxID=1506 RepID=UPI003F2DFD4F
MNIMHYTLGLPPYRSGGLTKYSWDLMKEQARDRENNINLLFPGVMNNSKKTKIKYFGNRERVKVYEIINPLPVPLLNGITDIKEYTRDVHTIQNIKEIIEKEKIEIFHIHTLMGLPIEVVREAKALGCKVVFSTHDYFGICPKVNLLDCDGQVCDGDVKKCSKCNQTAFSLKKIKIMQSRLYRKFKETKYFNKIRKYKKKEENILYKDIEYNERYIELREYYKKIFGLVDKYHFNSYQTEEIYQKFIKCKGKVIDITHNTIKDRRMKKEFGEELQILYLGDTDKHKGLSVLLDALEQIKDEKWKLNIYGNSNEIVREKIEEKVKYNGKYVHEDLKGIFEKADVLIIPSICLETYGFILLEGLSNGMPIITSNLVGARFKIKHKETGYVVNPEAEELKKQIEKIILNTTEIQQINRNILQEDMRFDLGSHREEVRRYIYCE